MRRKLTIGMATFDDAEGVWWTIQSIRLHHPEVANEIEFLVIDNHSESPHGKAVRNFLDWVKGAPVRYIAVRGVQGTAVRDYIFRLADTTFVLCIDCHVLLVPGALRRLIDGFEAGLDNGDLIQGPMLFDSLTACATHMALRWRDNMWGIWATAWRCLCGQVFQTARREEDGRNVVAFEIMNTQWTVDPHPTIEACAQCGKALPKDAPWEGHEHMLREREFAPATDSGEPFEIPAHGLGLFACRKDAWLGFNPQMKGFGGEEGYIHEKFRQAGRKTMCVPALAWLHRFTRVAGVPYTLHLADRAWNYLIGFRELGLPITPILQHFEGKVPRNTLEELVLESEGTRS